jgi:hypothetical protein
MRLINGVDLQTLLNTGPLEPRRAVHIIEQVAVSHMVMPPPRPSKDRNTIPQAMDQVIATASPSTATTASNTATTAPFTGTYRADFTAPTLIDGGPLDGAKPSTATWGVRSVCGPNGCVATASRVSGDGGPPVSTLVFDALGGRWVA